jgi:integrase
MSSQFQSQSLHHARITAPMTLSNDQLRQLLRVAKDDPRLSDLYDVASIISYTGIRLREFSTLRWADVDFANSRAEIFSGKAMSQRCIPIGPDTLKILEARRCRKPVSVFVLGESPMSLLLRVARQLREVGNRIGVGLVSASVLRHTFFMRLLTAGMVVPAVMAIGGFKHPSLVMKFIPNQLHQCREAVPFLTQIENGL